MTSANVIEYDIRDNSGKMILQHSQNIMCKTDIRKLLALENPETLTIHPWGYDEEEEIWEGKSEKLDKWLKKNKNEINT